MMRKCFGWLMLLAAVVACGGRAVPPTVIIEMPTRVPTVAPAATLTTAPTMEPAAVPATEPPEGTGGGGEGAVVLLVDYKSDPPMIAIVDPATGAEQGSFAAPGLTELSSPRVGGPFVFYLDQSSQIVKRVGFEGSVTELRFITSGTDYFQGDYLPSSDGTVIAWGTSVFDTSGGNDTHITLNVANVDGSEQKAILDERLKDVSILPQPIQWSPDGKFLYYTDEPYGIGGYILFWGGPDLKRVDVQSGTITEILPDTGCLCPMTVSPDGTTVAYIAGYGPLELVLHDVATGDERRLSVDAGHLQAGDIVWSPDGKALVYTMAISNFENPESEKYAIARVDAATLSQTILIPDDQRLLQTAVWPTVNAVWLNDKDNNAWQMNPETGEVMLVEEGKRVVK